MFFNGNGDVTHMYIVHICICILCISVHICFRQVIGIPMGTICAPLLADLFLYSYENEFLDNMIRSGHRRLPGRLIYAIDT